LGLAGVIAVAAGDKHTCVVLTGGGVRCWGVNYLGAIGDGTMVDRDTPTRAVGFP
jgi:hypothetical protein